MRWQGDGEWLSCVAVELLSLLLVSVLWGCTNPLLKRGTEGIEEVSETSRVSQLLAEVKFLFSNIKVKPGINSPLTLHMCEIIHLYLIAPSAFSSTWSLFFWTRVALWSTIIHSPPQVRHALGVSFHHRLVVAAVILINIRSRCNRG